MRELYAGSGVCVVGLGASTPVGRDVSSTAAAVRAGISGFAEHPFVADSNGEPVRVAIAPWVDVTCGWLGRIENLLMTAVEQALFEVMDLAPQLRMGLALALPPPRPGLNFDVDVVGRFVTDVYRGMFAGVATFAVGHAGGAVAIEAACRRIEHGTIDACVIAGVDSYLVPETLEWLEEEEQLHGAGRLNNAWGFVPGEAAGAVLLVSVSAARQLGLQARATVLSVGTSVERNRIKTETVCLGEGLTTAIRLGLVGLPAQAKVTDMYCDMNGEPYRADEFGFAALRTNEQYVSVSDFVAPADCWGDVGAASVPLMIVLASVAGRKAYAKGAFSFVWASSETGERGSVLLQTPLVE